MCLRAKRISISSKNVRWLYGAWRIECHRMRPCVSLSLAALSLPLMISAALPPPAELPANPQPPDLLTMRSGERVATKADWESKRAPELRTLVQHYEYGVMPPQPERFEVTLIREDKQALGGKATLRELDVRCTKPDARIHLMVVVPNARSKPAPCFLGLNFSGNYALLEDPQIQMPQGYVSDRYAG